MRRVKREHSDLKTCLINKNTAENKIENLRRYSELGRMSNDTTGELDEASNDFSRGAPLWYQRIEKENHKTLLRPSLKVSNTKQSSTVFDSDSKTGNFNPPEKDWYVGLSKYEQPSINSPTKKKNIRQSASGVPKNIISKSLKKVHSSSESDSNVMDSLRKKKKLDKSNSPASRNTRQNRDLVLMESDDSDSEKFLCSRQKSLHLLKLKKEDSHEVDAFFTAAEDEPSTLENPNSSTNRKSASKSSFLSNKDSFNKSKNVEEESKCKESTKKLSSIKSPYKIKVFSQDEIKACNDALAKRLQKSEMMEKEILKSEAQNKASLQKKANPTKIKKPLKPINKAYIVNGAPYKQPKLPRPACWATDSLYKFIFKKLEPKYGLRHRILAEKIVRDLGDLSKKALKAKKYAVYQQDLEDVMKKMAKLGIIENQFDWNSFCIDFLPYDLREKFTPMMLPAGNVNIPYNPDDLLKPLI